jgi:hypothetical protein
MNYCRQNERMPLVVITLLYTQIRQETLMGSVGKVVTIQGRLQVHCSDDDLKRAEKLLEYVISDIPLHILKHKVFVRVHGYKNVASYTRARPGEAALGKALGREFFEKIGGLVGAGFQVSDDWPRSDLDGCRKWAVLFWHSGLERPA